MRLGLGLGVLSDESNLTDAALSFVRRRALLCQTHLGLDLGLDPELCLPHRLATTSSPDERVRRRLLWSFFCACCLYSVHQISQHRRQYQEWDTLTPGFESRSTVVTVLD